MFFKILCLLVVAISTSSTQAAVYSVKSDDGSTTYSNQQSFSPYQTNEISNPMLSLFAKSRQNQDLEDSTPAESGSVHVIAPRAGGFLAPHLEILQLVEIFLRFKGELGYRLNAIINDNWDLIRSVYQTLVSKVSTLHGFTLTGIQILRHVLEYAVGQFSHWQVTPATSYGGYGPPNPESIPIFNTNTFYK